MRRLAALVAVCLITLLGVTPSRADDKIAFGLDWKAEAEYGGYYQALATGIYKKHGLDVTIREGGPLINHMQLLMAGRLDFNLGGGRAIEFAAENLPFMAVAAIFQGGATGMVISTSHAAMRPENLSAAGAALRELKLA